MHQVRCNKFRYKIVNGNKGTVDTVDPIENKQIFTYIDYYLSYSQKQRLFRTFNPKMQTIFFRFVFPEEIASDNGRQFVSSEFQQFLKSCILKHTGSRPYCPRSNGKVERFHWHLQTNLRAVIVEGKRWENSIDRFSWLIVQFHI